MRRRRCKTLLLSGVLAWLASESAWALSILQGCTVTTVPVNFGTYNPLSAAPLTATGTVTVSCTALASLLEQWTIALSQGNSGNFNSRSMLNGTSVLSYNLYTSPSYTTIWGDGSGATGILTSPVIALQIGTEAYSYPVYGVIPAGQDRAAGTFIDTIVVTLNF